MCSLVFGTGLLGTSVKSDVSVVMVDMILFFCQKMWLQLPLRCQPDTYSARTDKCVSRTEKCVYSQDDKSKNKVGSGKDFSYFMQNTSVELLARPHRALPLQHVLCTLSIV